MIMINPAASVRPPAAGSTSRLEQLRSVTRKPGEASFFWFDPEFQSEAVKVLPGEYFVDTVDLPVMTTLGSCVAACLWDRAAGVGGLNHFMLPEGNEESGRYGPFAMELLINEMIKRGASRSCLEAKVFGGGQILAGMESMNVGRHNARFVLDYLRAGRIPVVSEDLFDSCARKVCFFPASGKAMVKRLAPGAAALRVPERAAAHHGLTGAGGAVDDYSQWA